MFTALFPTDVSLVLPFVKILALVLLLFHIVFSYILVRQVRRMILVVEAQISPAFVGISYGHLIASILIFFWILFFV